MVNGVGPPSPAPFVSGHRVVPLVGGVLRPRPRAADVGRQVISRETVFIARGTIFHRSTMDETARSGCPWRSRRLSTNIPPRSLMWGLIVRLRFLESGKVTRSSFFQAAARAIYPVGKICTVQRGPLRGLRFRVGPSMGFTYAWNMGVEHWDFGGLVVQGMCVYDIGANRGQSTLGLARAVGATGRVVAFEPVASIFDDLSFNAELNPSLQMTCVCAAVSVRSGEVDFRFDDNRSTQGRLLGTEYVLPGAKIISVPAVRLDDYRSEGWPVPQFLKIDVEGGAGFVLRGAQSLITRHRPAIYVELHGFEERNELRDFLTTFRYKAQTMSGLEVPDPTAGPFSPLICNPQ